MLKRMHTLLKRADAAASPICAPPRASVYTQSIIFRLGRGGFDIKSELAIFGSHIAHGLPKRTSYESLFLRQYLHVHIALRALSAHNVVEKADNAGQYCQHVEQFYQRPLKI